MSARLPSSTLFPYTTLFRSNLAKAKERLKYGGSYLENARRLFEEMLISKQERDKARSEEHTSELQSLRHLVCRLLLEKKNAVPPCNVRAHRDQDIDVCASVA